MEVVAGLKHSSQKNELRRDGLEDAAGFDPFLFTCFEKNLITGWSQCEASSFTNPLRKARVQAGAGVGCFPLQMLPERLDCRPELL